MDTRFDGCIAGIGTVAGLRVVVGHWSRSPFGMFTDVMVERPDGHRVLLAPDHEVAVFVAGTYRFDEVKVVPVQVRVEPSAGPTHWHVDAGPLRLVFDVAGRPALGHLLRAVPPWLATRPWWISLADAVASRVMAGVRTIGSAGNGRREYYAALDLHRIVAATVVWEGADQGHLSDVDPPVRFGFGSTPREPSLARIVTLIRCSGR